MTIGKDNFVGSLKTPLYQLCDVSVLLPRNHRCALRIESGHAIEEMLRKYPQERGTPQFAAIDNGRRITVFPRTDKRYRLRVLGTQFIEQ